MQKTIKRISLSLLLIVVVLILIIIIFVRQWSFTAEGRLPAKTAVLLHAINNQLVTLDMTIPRFLIPKGPALISRTEQLIEISDGSRIPVRIYRPNEEGPFPILMYYHGGAFLEGFGSIETHDNIARSLAVKTKSIVIIVGYRLAPSHIFPTAVEDSYDALLWAVDNAEELNGDSERVAVAGDSSGGNIATVVATMARDRNGPELVAQVLFYPLTTFMEMPLPSREIYNSGYYLLSPFVMLLAREKYTPEEWMWLDPYASPLNADNLSDLPPSYIITAEFDPLRDEGEAYASRLDDSGVYVEVVRYEGVMHAFISFYEVMHSGKQGLQGAASFLSRAFKDQLEPQPYKLNVISGPKGKEKVKDLAEAYVFAGYLLVQKGRAVVRNQH
jgi:acetyl esterase